MTRRLSLAILLPSGIRTGNFSVAFSKCGRTLDLGVCWPNAFLNMETLHKKWLLATNDHEKLEAYHPKILGFEAALKIKRKQASDVVEAVAHIALLLSRNTHR